MRYALEQLADVPDLTIYGPDNRLGVIAFNLGKHHAYDVGSFLDNYGIAVRTGHHCSNAADGATITFPRCAGRRLQCITPMKKWIAGNGASKRIHHFTGANREALHGATG